MKKIVLLLTILLIPSICFATDYELYWQASAGADGYRVYHKIATNPSFISVDNSNNLTWAIPSNFTQGTKYEFYVTAYKGNYESGHSDHILWTKPKDPIIIEIPSAPEEVIIRTKKQ